MRADVAIVGGGPAGCFAGMGLAERGFDVVIVEEHAEVGHPQCCAGIVGIEGLEELGIKPGKWALGKLRGAVVYPPSNKPIELTRGKVEAFVVDRAEFDKSLARSATKAGVRFLLKQRCVDVGFKDCPILKLKGEGRIELTASVLIGADGPTSTVARKLGLIKSENYVKCAQSETIAEARGDIAEIYLGSSFAPGFFGWLVKAGDICRVGIGAKKGNPRRMLHSFTAEHPVISNKVRGISLSECTGLIPEPLSRRLCFNSVLLVGDAAGQVKPLTGGGIYMGLSCARLAVEAVARALEDEDKNRLLDYERAVDNKFGTEFEFGVRAQKAFEQMTDDDLNILLGMLERADVRKTLLDNFRFDNHGKMIQALIFRSPELLRSIGVRRALKYVRLLAKP